MLTRESSMNPTNNVLTDEPLAKIRRRNGQSVHRSVMNVFNQAAEITGKITTEYISNTQGCILLTAPHSTRLRKADGNLTT
jgi:hypothetical protein